MIEWLYLSHQLQCTITTYITAPCQLIIKGCDRVIQLFGHNPAVTHVLLTQVYLQQLYSQSLEFQCAVAVVVGDLNIHLLSDKLLQNLPTLNIHTGEKFSPTPIPKATTIFTDSSFIDRKNRESLYHLERREQGETFFFWRALFHPMGRNFRGYSCPAALAQRAS